MDDVIEDESAEEMGWDSGPFCRHFGSPDECDNPCLCGHLCKDHSGDDCIIDGCPCDLFRNAD